MRQILYNRGHRTPDDVHRFVHAISPVGTEPFSLTGMQQAVQRILAAISKGEQITVFGDYDADGVTATALLVDALKTVRAQVSHYIPDRFSEGYGLNENAIRKLHAEGTALIITVDCGIRSVDEVALANDLGLEMIISDHHHPGETMPPALAIINPKQPGDQFSDKNLAGVGLAFKLASAFLADFPDSQKRIENLLDLVALGTVADLAPLVGENRALVRRGLEKIRRPNRQGIMALIGVTGLTSAAIQATDIGFVLGPRLNAAGRLSSADAAFQLLISRDVGECGELAQQLNNQNRTRQQMTREIQENAEEKALANDVEGLLLFAADPDYNPGIVGLAASKLVNKYYRPAIVAHQGENFTRASCRSIPEFHITDALDQCADMLTQHGGHAAAAGFTVPNHKLSDLVNQLKSIARRQLGDMELAETLTADLEIPLKDLRPSLLQELNQLEPTGMGNSEAKFVSRNLRVLRKRAVGRDAAHLKLTVSDGWVNYDAIAFGLGDWVNRLPARIDLLYKFETNEFNGRTTLQLNVKDLRPHVPTEKKM
jgi:single-stranded-DNA-specific exonuclease